VVASLIVCYVNSHEYCTSSGFRGARKVRDHDCATFQGIRDEVEAARGVGQECATLILSVSNWLLLSSLMSIDSPSPSSPKMIITIDYKVYSGIML